MNAVPRWVRATRPGRGIPAAGGPCPLDHGDQGAPDMPTDRYVCARCTGRLRWHLHRLDATMTDLGVALTGQVRFTAQRGGGHLERPNPDDEAWPQTAAATRLPVNLPVSDAAYVARATVLANLEWAIDVRGHHVPTTWAAVGTYLADALPWAARHPDGPQFVDELTAALVHATRTIDRPADRHYLGLCDGTLIDVDGLATTCGAPLYGPDAGVVVCDRCTTRWAVVDLRARQLERIDDHELAAVDMARVLAQVGIDVPARLIRLWKHRGQLEPAGVDRKGRPLYRVGDVLARNAQTDTGGSVPA